MGDIENLLEADSVDRAYLLHWIKEMNLQIFNLI